MQTNLNNWGIINAQIERSKIKRVNWVELLGHTLTEEITKHKLNGLNSENTFKVIKSKLLINNITETDILRRLKISVSARFGEQDAAIRRLKK